MAGGGRVVRSGEGLRTRYREDRSALNWRLLALGVALPLGLVALVVMTAVAGWGAVAALAAAAAFCCVLCLTAFVYRNFPTGILITDDELRTGAVRARRASRRTPTVTHQNRGLFTVPLDSVLRMRIVTDPAAVRELRRSSEYYTLCNRWGKPAGMRTCKLGVLVPPFMQAALVVDLDSDGACFPAARRARFSSRKRGRTYLLPERSPTWVIPTRHPERLRSVIDRLGEGQPPTEGRWGPELNG